MNAAMDKTQKQMEDDDVDSEGDGLDELGEKRAESVGDGTKQYVDADGNPTTKKKLRIFSQRFGQIFHESLIKYMFCGPIVLRNSKYERKNNFLLYSVQYLSYRYTLFP